MGRYVLAFEEIDEAQAALVGGKAANLGALTRIDTSACRPGSV